MIAVPPKTNYLLNATLASGGRRYPAGTPIRPLPGKRREHGFEGTLPDGSIVTLSWQQVKR